MSSRLKHRLLKLTKHESGAVTLENTLIFPVVFLISLFMLFIGIYFYQKVVFVQQTSLAAMQTAHHWPAGPNGYVVGSSEKSEQGLYWRLFDDSITQLLGLNIHESTEQAILSLPVTDDLAAYTFLQRKLLVGAGQIADGVQGELQFTHSGYKRTIDVAVEAPFQGLEYVYFTLPTKVNATAEAMISEPVEFLRTFELATGYVQRLLERVDSEQVGRAFSQFLDMKAPDSFQYHDDTTEYGEGAESYLRKIVNGQMDERILADGRLRRIDALDRHGIAHQAYLTFTTSRLRSEQMVKDVELLRTGEVNGVVWHFFRRTSSSPGARVGPPNAFIKELEESGIVVVIHD